MTLPSSTQSPVRCYIGIGANLDDPEAQCFSALESLNVLRKSKLVSTSSLYGSEPMGPPGQPPYINCAAALETTLEPEALLDELQAIENTHHRTRDGLRWGARTLDLDILLYGAALIATKRLTVPHPGITLRSFVLLPLTEIAPDISIPGHGPAIDFLSTAPRYGIYRLGFDDNAIPDNQPDP